MSVAAAAAPISIRSVVARSLDAVRRHWLVLGLLTYGLGFLPRLVLTLGIHVSYRHGHDDPAGFAISLARTLAVAGCLHFARATVTSAVVKPGGGIFGALASTLSALPALAPVWLASQYDTLWGYWVAWSWSDTAHVASMAIVTRLAMQSLATLLVTLGIALGTAAALGVLSPVIIAERLSLPRAIVRCWTLMRGSRWRVLALYVLVIAALMLLTLPGTWFAFAARSGDPNHVFATLRWMQSGVFEAGEAMLAVVLSSAYLELLHNERGALDDEVAEVFA